MSLAHGSSSWCFTISKALHPLPPEWDPEVMVWLIFQEEKSQDGYEHYQGAVVWKKRVSLKKCQSLLNRGTPHLEPMRSLDATVKYCSKADTQVVPPSEFGVRPTAHSTGTGHASDRILALIQGKATMSSIIVAEPKASLQSLGNIMMARSILSTHRETPSLIWVDSSELLPSSLIHAYTYAPDTHWRAYLGEEVVIFRCYPTRLDDLLSNRRFTTVVNNRTICVDAWLFIFCGCPIRSMPQCLASLLVPEESVESETSMETS